KFSKIVINADKIQGDIKSFNVFTWNSTTSTYSPNILSSSGNPALSISKPQNGSYFNVITIGRTAEKNNFTLQSALGAGNSKGGTLIARVYVTY
ncbi:hypothetical protein EBU71_16855, partial [bacterium]|nr:hypothetical protein [Candidatus Elulimicrobium humile]